MLRVVVDTNLLVRMVTGTPASSPLYRLWRAGRFELLTSALLLDELAQVLERPHLRRYLPPGAEKAFLNMLRAEAPGTTPALQITLFRHPQTDMPLEEAAAGQADYLVSADLDLTDDPHLKATMEARYGVRVVTLSGFLAAMERRGS